MSLKVVILKSAKQDLKVVRDYVVQKFSHSTWLETSSQLKFSMSTLASSPFAGSVPQELEMLNLSDFRQVIAGMNRIIYEVRQDIVVIHAVLDVRRDLVSQLTKRLLRSTR